MAYHVVRVAFLSRAGVALRTCACRMLELLLPRVGSVSSYGATRPVAIACEPRVLVLL